MYGARWTGRGGVGDVAVPSGHFGVAEHHDEPRQRLLGNCGAGGLKSGFGYAVVGLDNASEPLAEWLNDAPDSRLRRSIVGTKLKEFASDAPRIGEFCSGFALGTGGRRVVSWILPAPPVRGCASSWGGTAHWPGRAR